MKEYRLFCERKDYPVATSAVVCSLVVTGIGLLFTTSERESRLDIFNRAADAWEATTREQFQQASFRLMFAHCLTCDAEMTVEFIADETGPFVLYLQKYVYPARCSYRNSTNNADLRLPRAPKGTTTPSRGQSRFGIDLVQSNKPELVTRIHPSGMSNAYFVISHIVHVQSVTLI
eukprot:SAG11_NODE_2237_length_3650_cov_49.920867_2_plen_175_part_00